MVVIVEKISLPFSRLRKRLPEDDRLAGQVEVRMRLNEITLCRASF